MGVELIHDQHDLFGGRIEFITERLDDGGKVGALALRAHEDVPPPGQGFADQEERRRAVARVLSIHALDLPRLDRQRLAHVREQLLGGFVQTHLRSGGIVGPVINFQHVLHGGDELGVRLGRDAPTLL